QFRTHDQGRTCATVVRTLEELGYTVHVTVLNALNYGVAQRRERTFIVALRNDGPAANKVFHWPEPYPERADLAEILEPDEAVPAKLWGTDYIREKRLARLREQGGTPVRPSIWHENKGGHIGQHPFSCALRANASHSYLLVNGERRPTARELLRLQGFPDRFSIAVSHRALRKQCGNSVAVPVIAEVAAMVSGLL
ncbi:MAG: DNA cytosine methyltransferase, partial [Planctomycetota bacterium]